VGGDSDWATIAPGQYHVLALKKDGSLWGWGYHRVYGSVGVGPTGTDVYVPTRIGTDKDWVSVAAGIFHHSVALKADGSVWTWGSGLDYKLGHGDEENKWVPTKVEGLPPCAAITDGCWYTWAIAQDGTRWLWGLTRDEGNGGDEIIPTTARPVPVQMGPDADWVALRGGYYHTLAFRADGGLWAFGTNAVGQVGDPNVKYKMVPWKVGDGFRLK
jgi:alpha-tubulin suppressor-like RCC1 family protein